MSAVVNSLFAPLRQPRRAARRGRAHAAAPFTVVVIDVEGSLGSAGRHCSLLSLPFGTTTLLQSLLEPFSASESSRVFALSDTLPPDISDVCERGLANHVRVMRREDVREWLGSCESSDYVLLINARYWATGSDDFAHVLSASRVYRGATYAIGVGSDEAGLRERIECDSYGQIRRVRRLYNLMNWPELSAAPILWSVVPAYLLDGTDLSCLSSLRGQLIEKDVFTHDVPVFADVHDLSTVQGLLDASACMTESAVQRVRPGFSMRAPGVQAARDAHIDPSVRFVPPVIVQQGATIEPYCSIIGPTVIGPGARIREGSVITRSLLARHAWVPPGRMICEQVVVPCQDEPAATVSSDLPPAAGSVPAGRLNESRFGLVEPAGTTRSRRMHLLAKRCLDVICSALGLILLSPMLLLIAVLIRLDSPGPIFFRHRRERRPGEFFSCLKFRTMVADADRQQRELYKINEVDGPQFKLSNDPRVTRVGRWLRRFNLDELPQLFNVLVGQMSLVGPRPSPFRENQICVAWRRARLSVRPGMTGLWQICRDRSSDADFNQWIYYDLTYVRNLSIWLDLKIIFHTIWSGCGRRRVPLSKLLTGVTTPQST